MSRSAAWRPGFALPPSLLSVSYTTSRMTLPVTAESFEAREGDLEWLCLNYGCGLSLLGLSSTPCSRQSGRLGGTQNPALYSKEGPYSKDGHWTAGCTRGAFFSMLHSCICHARSEVCHVAAFQ